MNMFNQQLLFGLTAAFSRLKRVTLNFVDKWIIPDIIISKCLKQWYVFLKCCLKGNKSSNVIAFVLAQSPELASEEALHNRAVEISEGWWEDERCKVGDEERRKRLFLSRWSLHGILDHLQTFECVLLMCVYGCVCVWGVIVWRNRGKKIMFLAFYQLEAEQLDCLAYCTF